MSEPTGPEWIVVCIGCHRIKRNGKWTKARVDDVSGHSSGFCDRCTKIERERQQIEAENAARAIATRLRPSGPLSE